MRPPGYYRDAPRPDGRIRYRDGESWRGYYWTISRKLATFSIASLMAVCIVVGLPLMMSDPSGTGPDARRGDDSARDLGFGLMMWPTVVGALLLIGVHRRLLLQDDSPEVQ